MMKAEVSGVAEQGGASDACRLDMRTWSTVKTRSRKPANRVANCADVRMRRAPMSRRMISVRCTGCLIPSGTTQPPAFRTASWEIRAHLDFSKQSGTFVSGWTPRLVRCAASLFASSSSSRYVRSPSHPCTAKASGRRTRCSYTRSWMRVSTLGGIVSFHSRI